MKTSTDGIVWSNRVSGSTAQFNAIYSDNNVYIAGGTAGTLVTSTNINQAQYSPSYNVWTDFYVPKVTQIGIPTLTSSVTLYTGYYQTYIRAK